MQVLLEEMGTFHLENLVLWAIALGGIQTL